MKAFALILGVFLVFATFLSCKKKEDPTQTRIIFLHHSTGLNIWGAHNSIAKGIAFRFNKLYDFIGKRSQLPMSFKQYNKEHQTNYRIFKRPFPKEKPYGWHNFPYNYYEIWVKNAGDKPFEKQPTLEMLTKDYDVIVFKHCFPVSNIGPDEEKADINSWHKTIANYKLQYEALKNKMHEFPDKKFILFTGAVQVKAYLSEDEALRTKEFFNWVREEWDQADDNIYLWDLYSLQTEGGLYFKDEYAVAPNNSHPNRDFSGNVAKLLFNRIIDVIEKDGKGSSLTGQAVN